MHPITICSYAIYACVVGIISYYNLPWEWLALLAILLLSDTAFWIGKSYILYWHEFGRFSSHKLKRWVLAKMSIIICAVLIGICVSYLTKHNIVSGLLADVFIWLLIGAELISLIQNSIMIHTEKEIDEFDAISLVMTRMLNKFKSLIDKYLEH